MSLDPEPNFEVEKLILLKNKNGLDLEKNSHKITKTEDECVIPSEENVINNYLFTASDSVVPIQLEESDVGGGLLEVVCVPRVERFSELLSNLCSPCDADILFEDILVGNEDNELVRIIIDIVFIEHQVLDNIIQLNR